MSVMPTKALLLGVAPPKPLPSPRSTTSVETELRQHHAERDVAAVGTQVLDQAR